ncbi:MAG: hypothetical protein ACC645_12565, partial [Pirellulales bacterium]
RVPRVRGETMVPMPKGVTLTEGTIVALHRENDPQKVDADGVIMVWADYGMDVTQARNTRERRAQLWFEQDHDLGVSFRYVDTAGHDAALKERPGVGVVTDPWNKTNWIWQKVQIEGNHIRAKFWPAVQPEREGWDIEATYDGRRGARIGIRVNSGDMNLAYFAADPKDIHVERPKSYLHIPKRRTAQTSNLLLDLFLNVGVPVEGPLRVVLDHEGTQVGEARVEAAVPAGYAAFSIRLGSSDAPSSDQIVIDPPARLAPGKYQVRVTSKGYEAERSFEVVDVEEIRERFAATKGVIERLDAALEKQGVKGERGAALQALLDAAHAHNARASALFAKDHVEAAERTYRFAREALAELDGTKGDWLRTILPDDSFDGIPKLGARDAPARQRHVRHTYSPNYLVSFAAPVLEAQSLVMGRTYTVTIPWRVEGTSPDRDYAFHVWLANPLGTRSVAQSDAPPETPTSQWQPGVTYRQQVSLSVALEDPPGDALPSQQVVEDQYYTLRVTVTDPATGGHLILGNPPGSQPGLPGMDFSLGDVYVSSTPLEIHDVTAASTAAGVLRTDVATFRNVGEERLTFDALLTATTETGRRLCQMVRAVAVEAGAMEKVTVDWTPRAAGRVTLKWEAIRDGLTLTEWKRTVVLTPPENGTIRVTKANHVLRTGDALTTPVTIDLGSAPRAPYRVAVFAKGRRVGSATSSTRRVTVQAEPWFGYYDVEVDFGAFTYYRRLVATVAEADGTDLMVNGEPFIVKGTNVHGMFSDSPERTASVMRLMRELGFNTWRGDYPARWQIDLAYELNTAYTVLAPFSCVETEDIFTRHDGPPMGIAREISRLTVQRYRDSAGVLLWNSCNEVTGETADFLLSQYPVYRAFDPYLRPVHYANLNEQIFTEGQDVMGFNTYFGVAFRATGKQEEMQRKIAVAAEAHMPVIFCEFNSWYGAVPTTGVEALRDMYEWGVARGMAGGFQYMDGDSDRHPGVYDDGFNTHRIYNHAILKAFADAEVRVAAVSPEAIDLKLVNKRRFTLRGMTLECSVSGVPVRPMRLEDLPPRGDVIVRVEVPQHAPGPARTIEGVLRFTTHFGFQCKVPLRLILPRLESRAATN